MPAISVVIPTYNAAKFLREALDSLLAQTFPDWEAVCVNDGSTDNSLEILQEYAARDGRFHILDGPNGGYGKAMNRGMDAARGKYMAILEPDDILPPNAYKTLFNLAEEHGTDVTRGGLCQFYEENGEKTFNHPVDFCVKDRVFCPRYHGNVFFMAPNTVCALHRMDFLRGMSIRYHESPGASFQDTSFFFRSLAFAQSMLVTGAVVYLYRQDNPASSINTIDAKWQVLTREYDFLESRLREQETMWAELEPIFHAKFIESHMWFHSRLTESRQRDFAELFRERVRKMARVPYERLPMKLHPAVEALLMSVNAFMEKTAAMRVSPERQPGKGHPGEKAVYESVCPGVKIPHAVEKTYKVLGAPVCSVVGSRDLTVFRIMGVPVLKRQRSLLMKTAPDGVPTAVGYVQAYHIIGVPICKRNNRLIGV